jgi:16S rRNA (cytosine967-C5)-methyltransferase
MSEGRFAGILRNLTRKRTSGSIPRPRLEPGAGAEDRTDALATAASHPTWMARRWLQRFGEAETLELMASNNR